MSARAEIRRPDPATAAVAPRWVRWLPTLLILTDLTLEVTLPQTTAAGFLLTTLPVLVAFGFGPGVTAASGAGALALQLVLGARAGHLYEHHHLWAYLSTLLATVAGIALARQRTRQARHLVRARTVSEALQRTVLHPVPERVGGLRTSGLYQAAQDEVAIGGDLYELCDTRFGTRILLGDVRGKGLEAVRTVADVLGAFRALAHETADLRELADLLDRQVRRSAVEHGDEELFVTAVLVGYDPAPARPNWSAGATWTRCCSRAARCGPCRAARTFRSASATCAPRAPSRSPPCRWPPVRPCCCTPTASPRPATSPAPSTRSPTASPPASRAAPPSLPTRRSPSSARTSAPTVARPPTTSPSSP